MVSDLNKLAELVEVDSLPSWIRSEIESKKLEILKALETEGAFVFRSCDGKKFTIKAKTAAAA